MTPPKNPPIYERLYVYISLYTDVFRFKYMFNVSIRECFSVLNMCIVCIRNTARSKYIPLLCTYVDPYKFSTVHPPSLHLETGPIPLEAKCIKFQPLLGRRPALTTHYNNIITRANFPICKGLRDKKPRQFKKSSIF
jgi:hypothetical protein